MLLFTLALFAFTSCFLHSATGIPKEPVKTVGQYMGCYINEGSFRPRKVHLDKHNISPKWCAAKCAETCESCDTLVLDKVSCFCMDVEKLDQMSHTAPSFCTEPCPGDKYTSTCGGTGSTYDVYRIDRIEHDVWRSPFPPNGTHYRFMRYENGWNYARQLCHNKGSELALMMDEDDKGFILKNVIGTLQAGWIGAKRYGDGDTYKWVNGETVREKVNDNGSDCLYLDRLELHTANCTDEMPFICQANTNYEAILGAAAMNYGEKMKSYGGYWVIGMVILYSNNISY